MRNDRKFSRIQSAVEQAIAKLWKNDADLLDVQVNERSISHRLACYLQQEFSSWDVDCEYNRKMGEKKTLHVRYDDVGDEDADGNTVFPDIIVHHRVSNENLLVIEMKKRGNTSKDRAKLRAFTGPEYKYEYGLLLQVRGNRTPKATWFKSGKEESVATLLGIGRDLLSVFRYFSGPNFTMEGSYAGTGRIRRGSDRRNHAC